MSTGSSRPAGDFSGVLDQVAAKDAEDHSLPNSPAQEESRTAPGPPYPPGWADKLADWARGLPVPVWVFYLALGLVMNFALLVSAWTGGALAPGAFALDYFLSAMTVSYFLVLIHYLDDSAAAALARFRPVMTVDDATYDKLSYQLTTLPAVPTWIASALGAAYSLGSLVISIITNVSGGIGEISPVVPIVEIIFRTLIYALIGVVIYHTIHQLRTVNEIYINYTRINLFQLGPMYALSGLAARTAIGIGIPTYLWFQFNSSSSAGISPADIFETVFLGVIIIATFIWPLWGAHNLLEREKQRLQDDAARRVEATVDALHSRIDSGELQDRGPLKETLDGLVTEQSVIDKLRTWPWRTETVRGLGLAFLLPIIIWIVQRVLERLGL